MKLKKLFQKRPENLHMKLPENAKSSPLNKARLSWRILKIKSK